MKTLLPSVEPLEPRIAPAAVTVNPAAKTATWTDFDGDLVTLKWTGAQPPDFTTTDAGMGLLVDKIALNPANHANGAFTLSVKPGATGDGMVEIGRLDATGVPLKSWNSPKATLAEIDAGNGATGVGTLVVAALGTRPYDTFGSTGTDGTSTVLGTDGTVLIRGDVAATRLELKAGSGTVKTVTVMGSLQGATSGVSSTCGVMLVTAKTVNSITIGGSLIGGNDDFEGGLVVSGSGALPVVGRLTVKGSVIGGTDLSAGLVEVAGRVGTLAIGGDVRGNAAPLSGAILVGDVGTLTVGGSIIGGSLPGSGIASVGNAGAIVIKGSIQGGLQTAAATPELIGALIVNGSVKTITVFGDVQAGTFGSGTKVDYNGAILVEKNAGAITVKGSVMGRDGALAYILAGGQAVAPAANFNAIGKLVVGHDVTFGYIAAGHTMDTSASGVQIGVAENPDAGIGSVVVGGNWLHSTLTAGINDPGSNGASDSDTRDTGAPARQAVLGPVVIKGQILDNPHAFGFSGFEAEKIVKIVAGGVTLFKTGNPARSLDPSGFVDIREI